MNARNILPKGYHRTMPKGHQHQMTITISHSLYDWLRGDILQHGPAGATPESVIEQLAWSLRDNNDDDYYTGKPREEEARFQKVAELTGLTIDELDELGGLNVVEKYERRLNLQPLAVA